MTSVQPPYPYYNGIIYNPSFFSSSSTPLTISKANKLYLNKNVVDTATALETFTAGIKTSTILLNGNSNIFEDTTSTLVTNFGKTSYIANFGTGASNSRFGEGSIYNCELGRYMPSRSGTRIAIGSCIDTSYDTNIAIGTTTGNDTFSGTNKICIGGPSNFTLISSDLNVIGRTSGSSTTMNGPTTFTNPIILGTVATLNTQMGYQLSASGTAVTTGVTSFLIGAGLTSLPVGLYILNGSCSFPSNTFTFLKVCFYASTTQQTSGTVIAAGSNNVPYGSLIINESSQIGVGINLYPLSAVINVISGTQFYSIMGNMNGTAQTMTMALTATRIG